MYVVYNVYELGEIVRVLFVCVLFVRVLRVYVLYYR